MAVLAIWKLARLNQIDVYKRQFIFLARVKKVPRTFLILYKVTQWFASAWVAEFAEGFSFDLTNPFTGHVEDFPHIFQGPHFSIIQTETKTQDVLFTVCQSIRCV